MDTTIVVLCDVFSDESRFSLQSDSRRTSIWRAPGTRYHQENTIERHRYGGAGWLFWGRIILGSRTDLHVLSVTMTGLIYRDVILEQHVRWFRGAMGAEFLFMDDNARFHRVNIVYECLQSEDITRMDWPAYSPDLNSIEHEWDMLGRRIAARQPPPTCLPELRRALLDEWCNIPQDQIDNLILSIPRRSEEFGINQSVVLRAWKAFQTIGTAVRKDCGGHPRKKTAMDDRYIVLQEKGARYQLASTIAQQLYSNTATSVAVYCGQTPSQRWPIHPAS
ncbi:transposable element Tc3 transposase [Trichonephila clavipes]|nr:transposable element Tc3 transposase [Trichonephila clavipes]